VHKGWLDTGATGAYVPISYHKPISKANGAWVHRIWGEKWPLSP